MSNTLQASTQIVSGIVRSESPGLASGRTDPGMSSDTAAETFERAARARGTLRRRLGVLVLALAAMLGVGLAGAGTASADGGVDIVISDAPAPAWTYYGLSPYPIDGQYYWVHAWLPMYGGATRYCWLPTTYCWDDVNPASLR